MLHLILAELPKCSVRVNNSKQSCNDNDCVLIAAAAAAVADDDDLVIVVDIRFSIFPALLTRSRLKSHIGSTTELTPLFDENKKHWINKLWKIGIKTRPTHNFDRRDPIVNFR